MTMKLIFGYGAFILCFSMVVANLGGSGSPRPGGLTKVSNEDAKENKDIEAGKQHILETLAAKVNSKPGYKTEVNLPDLEISQQVVAGMLYHYSWKKEEYKTKCVDNALCQNGPAEIEPRDVNCKASYWVKPWQNFKQFQGIKCN